MCIEYIDHMYIVCNKEKESDKYNKWLKWLEYNKVKEEFVTFYCYKWCDELTDDDIKNYSNDDGTLVKLFPFRANFPLKRSEISLSINFIHIFKDALDNQYKNILVFESDAILHPNFIELLNKYLMMLFNSSSIKWDMLSIGAGMNKHYPIIERNKFFYVSKEMRCLDSFVINETGMQFIVNNLKQIKLPIDEHFDIFVKENKLRLLWLEPTLVVQGSQTGINRTTIRYTDAIYVNNCEWLKDVLFK